MATILLDEKKDRVRKAFDDYTKNCPHADEIIKIRADQWLEEVINFVDASHDVVIGDYSHLGKRINEYEQECKDCREGVMMKNDLFTHGDFYVKERLKVAVWIIGLVGGLIIALLSNLYFQQAGQISKLTELSIKMDKRIAIIEAHVGHDKSKESELR